MMFFISKDKRARAVGTGFFFLTTETKSIVLNSSKRTDGCFTAAFFQTQHASFSGRCGGRPAGGGGSGTRKNIPAFAQCDKTTARPPVVLCSSK